MSDPRQKDFDERHTKLPTVQALTKREYFAAMALQGLCASQGWAGIEGTVKQSIQMADELIKQLSQ